jgi:hypothetical protein
MPYPRAALGDRHTLAPKAHKGQLTASSFRLHANRARSDLLPPVPNGDPAAILDRALTLLVAG